MKVRDLLSDSSKWTQGAFARDAKGRIVRPDSPQAVCWCLLGALQRVYGQEVFGPYDVITDRVAACVPRANIVGWQDAPERRFEDIVAVVRQAGV